MGGERCAAPGCGRFVSRGARWCPAHADGSALAVVEARAVAAAEFQRRLEAGDYARLLDARLRAVIGQAAADPGLTDEIGVLRLVLARLLLEEQDLAKLVTGTARLASVIVQAARTQRALAPDANDELTKAIDEILAELEPTL